MQSEGFDKKMKEAAENHHPAYDEHAWARMEDLLDKHLPQEKEKKRRFIFILFFFMLLGGTGYVFYRSGGIGIRKPLTNYNSGKEKDQANPEDKIGNNLNPRGGDKNSRSTDIVKDGSQKSAEPSDQAIDKTTIPGQIDKKENKNHIIAGRSTDLIRNSNKEKDFKKLKSEEYKTVAINEQKKDKSAKQNKNEPKDVTNTNPITEKVFVAGKEEDPILKAIQPEPSKDLARSTNDLSGKKEVAANRSDSQAKTPIVNKLAKSDQQNKRSKKTGTFFLSASVAPDLSVVGLSEAGKIKIASGVGAGYTKGRFTLRSGFYTVRKVYNAYADSYHAPSAFYARYPYLQEVNADCRVYEIPVLLSYNFGKGLKRNWFVSTGLSSYLMKRETYNYFYKYSATSPVTSRERTIRNDNQHYFSVLTFSGGYQKAISKKVSIVAEPYLKVPVTGIGFGKVKLNSAGVMFSVTYKPFHTGKRK
jgi:hypothetical protein